ncbi:MAG: exodeoxyribonuclease III [Crocinitomicaceae bacterium]|nr:exodeoxyribonuclease III [Crocinitomicaceae bacterium]MDG1776398.1 exodeoxyribonuclease III [Crocinitomicaceae bacterium]
MNILSFNVNGVRAISKKNFFEDMSRLQPDVICLQETKATVEQVKETVSDKLSDYEVYANEADRKGYSGTAILTKVAPISVSYDMNIPEHDKEGRVICAEFDDYFLITVYTPNSGNDLRRLDYRQQWDQDFLAYIKTLEKTKPTIVCGDLNVAHKDIDLARPKPNYNKSAGYMQKEIDGIDAYTKNGLIDTFRLKHKDDTKYSWWSYRGGARDRNVGWRIDYFLVSESMVSRIAESNILNDVMGSDHCPTQLKIA